MGPRIRNSSMQDNYGNNPMTATRELARTRNGAKVMERTLEDAAAEIARLRAALVAVLVASPAETICSDFHHTPSDRHNYSDKCPSKQRWDAAIEAASVALAKQEKK